MAPRRAAAGPKAPSKGELTRAAIANTLIDRVNRMAIDDIHIGEVCTSNNLAVGAFYFHFNGKNEALEAVAIDGLNWLYQGILARPPASDLYDEITALVGSFHAGHIERGAHMRAVYLILAVRRPVRMVWLALRAQIIARLADSFAAAHPPSDAGFASTYVLAQFLMGALERFFDDVYVAPPDGELGKAAAAADVFVRQQADVWYRAAMGADPHKRKKTN